MIEELKRKHAEAEAKAKATFKLLEQAQAQARALTRPIEDEWYEAHKTAEALHRVIVMLEAKQV